MDFMMDKESGGYLVLILFILKQEKSLPSNKSKRRELRADFTANYYMNCKSRIKISISSKFFEWNFY